MTEHTFEFKGKHIKSPEDLERLIKDAEWQVEYYEREVQRAKDNLYTRQLALESLKNEFEITSNVSRL
tara:strand:- start:3749 stop:3952 length:204 start_codon:yes stop_codon:yes gene_type:complete